MSSSSSGRRWLVRMDAHIVGWMDRQGPRVLRIALATIFIWFGALKIFSASPADDLVRRTIYWFRPEVFLPILGIWEVAIGVCLVFPRWVRLGLLLLALQIPGTFLPLVLLPDRCFERFPFELTMEGQYIIKNLLIVGAALVVGGSVRTPIARTGETTTRTVGNNCV